MIIDKFDNLPLYFSCLPGLDKAAEFLAGENIADGHYEIDGEKYSQTCRAMSQRSLTAICALRRIKSTPISRRFSRAKSASTGRRSGSLKEESEEYSKGGDIAFYSGDEHMRVTLSAGEFLILFPGDANKPCIRSGGKVKKAVVKLAL